MLCFAHVHPELWFFSLFALVPLLWRLCHVSRMQAPVLGLILASTYVVAGYLGNLPASPVQFFIRLVALNVAFAGFAFALNHFKSHLKCHPLCVAALWVASGSVLARHSGVSQLPGEFVGPDIIAGLGSLGGLVVWSSVIVLGNWLILLLARYVKRRLLRHSSIHSRCSRRLCIRFESAHCISLWYVVPHLRGPPVS
ncbi:MAG: hypothetical protein OEV49_15135 [candidate division Zixibacteria bacterium]|nr:hypothetical protein [candidate division Zixibacteria bacterium]MDH3936056.1 hypothetical protein [candidate division Zixibacteria bacterium]MDH4034375.1 hypothetical protein [candidate division Zixibacteria bacterium]